MNIDTPTAFYINRTQQKKHNSVERKEGDVEEQKEHVQKLHQHRTPPHHPKKMKKTNNEKEANPHQQGHRTTIEAQVGTFFCSLFHIFSIYSRKTLA
jgi:hypothetical protein